MHAWLLALFLVGCGVFDDTGIGRGQYGEEDTGAADCADATVAVAPDDDSHGGFTPAAAATALTGDHTDALDWVADGTATGDSTALTIGITADAASTVWVTDSDCGEALKMSATVTFVTADGAFDETWSDVTLILQTSTQAYFDYQAATMNGSFDRSTGPLLFLVDVDTVTSRYNTGTVRDGDELLGQW